MESDVTESLDEKGRTEEEAPPILNFRKRPEDEEEEETKPLPVPDAQTKGKGGKEGELYHWDVHLLPRHVTTNTGIVGLTENLQKFLEAVVRGMLTDHKTPIHHPAVTGYINMHSMCEQIKGVFKPQQVQMTPEQIAELQRQMGQGRMRLS
jgi:hypothetical protein